MLDLNNESLIPFVEAAKRLPRRRAGRPTHVATLHRWRSRGLRGVRLEAVRVGGVWHTSVEALNRFFARLTSDDHAEDAAMQLPSPPNHDEQAEAELDAIGILGSSDTADRRP